MLGGEDHQEGGLASFLVMEQRQVVVKDRFGCSCDRPCCAAQLAADVRVQQVGVRQGGRVGGCGGHEV